MLVSITQWVIDSRHHPSAWNCLNHRKQLSSCTFSNCSSSSSSSSSSTAFPHESGGGASDRTLSTFCATLQSCSAHQKSVYEQHTRNLDPLNAFFVAEQDAYANFQGEHRVVSFLQLSEISFTRDTHGAVAHMAGENIVRSCKGQHPIQNFFCLYLYL